MERNRPDITEMLKKQVMDEPGVDINVIDELGLPAILDMCAEECVELAHACLKLSRKMRDDNPTPKSLEECTDAVCEEMGDVMLSMNLVTESGLLSRESIESWYLFKESRMKERIAARAMERTKRELDLMGVYMKGE